MWNEVRGKFKGGWRDATSAQLRVVTRKVIGVSADKNFTGLGAGDQLEGEETKTKSSLLVFDLNALIHLHFDLNINIFVTFVSLNYGE